MISLKVELEMMQIHCLQIHCDQRDSAKPRDRFVRPTCGSRMTAKPNVQATAELSWPQECPESEK